TADERHQRHQLRDRRRRHPGLRTRSPQWRIGARHDRRGARGHQYFWRLPGDRADARDVQEEGTGQKRRRGEEVDVTMSANAIALWYLLASALFILALKALSHPLTARRGNRFGIFGMTIAVLVTLAI